MPRLGQIVDIQGGGTPSRKVPDFWDGDIPWATVKDFSSTRLREAKESISFLGLEKSATRVIPAGNIIVPTRMAVGKAAINEIPIAINQDLKALTIKEGVKVDVNYLLRFILSRSSYLLSQAKGATEEGITIDVLKDLNIPLPRIEEQVRIATILDKADEIRHKRQKAIQLVDEFLRSLFLDIFGDPVSNPKSWPMCTLGDLAQKFSDGPFGSNLKSSDYVESGVRVIRLQNIGVGQFLDMNCAYISKKHFESIRKHECLPGDVIIGTLGEPNLRACIQPDWLAKALNKADCIQMRVRCEVATPEYIESLLNQPGALHLAAKYLHGQTRTRTRINSGKLKKLEVPLPPIELQRQFTKSYGKLKYLLVKSRSGLDQISILSNSLQSEFFSGL